MNTKKNSDCSLAHVHEEYTNYAWYKYALGYNMAAITLIDKAMSDEEKREVPNELLYPIFFCFRHFVELLLKKIIAEYNEITGSEIKIPKNHKIKPLFQEVVPIINDIIFDKLNNSPSKFKSTFTIEDTSNLEKVIYELDKYDSVGESFRFPVYCSGRTTLNTSFHVPLAQLKEKINQSFDNLNHISFMMVFTKRMNPTQSAQPIPVKPVTQS